MPDPDMSNVGTTDMKASRAAREAMDETLWWKPETGGKRWRDNFIRALPGHVSMEGNFFYAIPMHYGVGPGRAIVPCPRRAFKMPCPVCIEAFRLRDAGQTEEGDALLPSYQGYMNVVALDENGEPVGDPPIVRVFRATRGIIDELLEIAETKYGDFTHLETGRVINIRRRGKGGKEDTKYSVSAASEASPFDYPELVASLHDLTTISPYRSVEQMAALLEGPDRADPFGKPAVEAPAATAPRALPGAMTFEPPPPEDEAVEDDGLPPEAAGSGPVTGPVTEPAASNEEMRARLRAQLPDSPPKA